MILVLASLGNTAAGSFASELRGRGVVVRCPDLLASRGALVDPDIWRSTITAGGRAIALGDVRGVVNLLPVVSPDELPCYAPEERAHQADECHALLTFVLAALPCPVVNRPTPGSLSGPFANPIGWFHLAASLGIPVSSVTVDSRAFRNPFTPGSRCGLLRVVSLGRRIVDASHTVADDYTATLAARAGVEHLCAWYESSAAGIRFRDARGTPDIGDPTTRAALARFSRAL